MKPWCSPSRNLSQCSSYKLDSSPDITVFWALLKDCAKNKDLLRGTKLHDDILRRGLLKKCSDGLVSMYARCGELAKARELFERCKSRNAVTWTALIMAHAHQGQSQEALDYFEEMQQEGLSPNAATFTSALKVCGSIKAIEKGEEIHDKIGKLGLLHSNIVLSTALLDMYAKCGALTKARWVLENIHGRDVISWNALIAGYGEHGEASEILTCFEQMKQEGLSPDSVTFTCVLKACGSLRAVDKGEEIHDEIAKKGMLGKNTVLGTALVDMYAKCSSLSKARRMLEELHVRDAISWTALITGYAEHGDGEEALECFQQMQREGIRPNAVTFASTLKACGTIGAAVKGEMIHDEIAKQGILAKDVVLCTSLVDMYAKCGAFAKAQQVLVELHVKDVMAWNTLIAGYTEHGKGAEALSCYEQMKHEGLLPNAGTFACTLNACASIGAVGAGKEIHDEVLEQGLLGNDPILVNALVNMYAKCGSLVRARQLLKELHVQDVATWTAVIGGYAGDGEGAQALDCLEQMQREGLCPDAVTLLCCLKACGSIGAAGKGEKIHDEIRKQGLLGSNAELGNALVDMYAKCGALTKAQQVLEELPFRDVTSWTALIVGLTQHGKGKEALKCFEQMQREGISPDATSLSCVLSACSRLGLTRHAERYFVDISKKYGIKLNLEHLTCMVDAFGRAGQLDKAMGVIKEMPDSDSTTLCALLGACEKWGDVKVGRWAFEEATNADRSDAAVYTLMANIYAVAGMQEEAEKIEALRIENKAWMMPP